MPKFKPNTSSAMKKKSAYKMKYQGNASAFPFKSPIKDDDKKKVDAQTEDFLKRQGMTQEEIDALKHKENIEKSKEKTYTYDGKTYTQKQIDIMRDRKRRGLPN